MFAGQERARQADDRPEAPEAIRHPLTQYDDTLEPSFAYRWPKAPEDGSRYALLGLAVPGGVDLDRKPPDPDDGTWVESPQKKFERLLYETGIPIGLIFQESAVRLVYRPESQQSGYITFPLEALLKPAGRLACTALKALLNHQRIHVLPGRQRLAQILAESRKFQNEVSTQLAEQVLAAPVRADQGVRGRRRGIARPAPGGGPRPGGPDPRDLRGAAHRPDAAGLPALRRGARDLPERRPLRPQLLDRRAVRPARRGRGPPPRHDGPALRGLGPPDQPVPAGLRRGEVRRPRRQARQDPRPAGRPLRPGAVPVPRRPDPGERAGRAPPPAPGGRRHGPPGAPQPALPRPGAAQLPVAGGRADRLGLRGRHGLSGRGGERPVGRDQAREARGRPGHDQPG